MKKSPLFDELGVVSTNSELLLLQERYHDYDPAYVCQSALVPYRPYKLQMEKMWQVFGEYADAHFLGQFKINFAQRSWELYLGFTFLMRGFSLSKRAGLWPDFVTTTSENEVWVEAVCPTKGSGDDRVPDMPVDQGAFNIPEEKILLRITNAINEKIKPTRVLTPVVPYVIAINIADLDYPDLDPPFVVKALYGVGDLQWRVPVGGSLKDATESYANRPTVSKMNGEPISMTYFCDTAHSQISAVLYCREGILNSPSLPDELGHNFYIFHNPFATHPLPLGHFDFVKEEWGSLSSSQDQVGVVRTRLDKNPNRLGY